MNINDLPPCRLQIHHEENEINDVECRACQRRQARVDRINQIRTTKRVDEFYIVLVRITRHFGGPEEGGWWYDWYNVEEVYRAWFWREGLAVARKLRE